MGKKNASINIGMSDSDRAKIAEGLSALLADSYTLYMMTHNFHWNVTGPRFNDLHNMFMGQYTEQWNALDTIAERIRALGHPAPGTYKEFVKLASIKEVEGVPKATEMIRLLAEAGKGYAEFLRGINLNINTFDDLLAAWNTHAHLASFLASVHFEGGPAPLPEPPPGNEPALKKTP